MKSQSINILLPLTAWLIAFPITARAQEKGQLEPPKHVIDLQKGLVSEWRAELNAKDALAGNDGDIHGAISFTNIGNGTGFLCNGDDAGVNVKDTPNLKITKSLTISAWLDVYGYPKPERLWGQIVMRADDRVGLDPYFLAVSPDHKLTFTVETEQNTAATVASEVPLGQAFLATATLDDATGLMRLYADGVVLGETHTDIRPFKDLDPNSNPGIGIGFNQGYPKSPYHMGFNGVIGDVRIYDRALSQEEVQALYAAGVAPVKVRPLAGKDAPATGKE
jgi:hypothetical protein